MYNGFDWYGRTLEVREVSDTLFVLQPLLRVSRIATLDSLVPVPIAEVACVAVCVVALVAGSGVASGVGYAAGTAAVQVQAATSPTISTPTTLVQTKLRPVGVCLATEVAMAEGSVVASMPNRASRSWFAT